MKVYKISYGPDHAERLRSLTGGISLHECTLLRNISLWGTVDKRFLLPDGRVLRTVEQDNGFSTAAFIWGTQDEFEVWEHNDLAQDQDIEGRGGRNFSGQRIAKVQTWIEIHPGQKVPRRGEPCLSLYDRDCPACVAGHLDSHLY
jgi:hypothetical protein